MNIHYILPLNMQKFNYTKDNFLDTHFSINIAREMVNKGNIVELHTFWDHNTTYIEENFKVHFYKVPKILKKFSFLDFSYQLLLKNFSSDSIIHFHEPYSLFFIPFIVKNKSNILAEHHGSGSLSPFQSNKLHYRIMGLIRKKLIRTLFNRCNKIIVHNSKAKLNFINYGVKAHKIQLVPNGIDHKEYNKKTEKRTYKGNKKSETVFLYVGRITENKGIRELVESFERISKSINTVKLVIIGPLQDIKLKSIIKKYWVGFKSRSELQNYYVNADVFCLPSYNEPFGIVILEALFFDLPIITTDNGGIKDFITKDNVSFIPPKNINALESSMRMMLDKNIRLRKGSGGRNLVITNFTWEKICNLYLLLYKEMLNK